MAAGFLPTNRREMEEAGIVQPDFVYVCGDAYVDHPSFGSAIISRVLESFGYSVVMLCQPDWRDQGSVTVFGEPRLGFLVSSGNMDSMVNHYTVSKKHRREDAYSPGGAAGMRPDYAVIVYCNLIRRTYKKTPIIIGGIEASLRRLGHYDYWSDKIRRSILLDSGADILAYGMGEKTIVEIADALNAGIRASDVTFIRGTVFKTRNTDETDDADILPAFEDIKSSKESYARSFAAQFRNTDPFTARRLVETYDGSLYVIQNPPQMPLTMQEMDDIYALPYMRACHPSYEAAGGIPALTEVKFSLTSNRGCYGDCSFCALTFHEGRIIQVRSHDSIIAEAKQCIEDPDFKGYIHDVGGPTAEFRAPACAKQLKKGTCQHRKCLYPSPCPNMNVDHSDYLRLLRKLRNLPKVKKVFIRSGIRFDYLMADKNRAFFRELCKYHISGQLRVAPEHISDNVLCKMGKPPAAVYQGFVREFDKINRELGMNQYVVPYLMSSHPGSTLKDAIALAEYIRELGYMPEQVQDFYPTPGTISTCMYYTGLDPETMKPVYTATSPHEKAMQRALIQYRDPDNYDLVKEALLREGRGDLIGFGKECLIPPRKISGNGSGRGSRRKTGAAPSGVTPRTKYGTANSGLNARSKSGAANSGLNARSKSGAAPSGATPRSKSGAANSGLNGRSKSGAANSGLNSRTKSGAANSGTNARSKSGAANSGTNAQKKRNGSAGNPAGTGKGLSSGSTKGRSRIAASRKDNRNQNAGQTYSKGRHTKRGGRKR